VAKLYPAGGGEITHANMQELWRSSFGERRRPPGLPRPIEYLPDVGVLLMERLPGRPLVELGATDGDIVDDALRLVAALHGCGAHGRIFGWKQEMAEVREKVVHLAEWRPGLEGALEPSLAHLESLEASHPPQRPVPSHRSFRPAQVLLHDGHIAFIDFDGFCEAEPAMDLALFRASLKQSVMRLGSRAEGPEPSLDILSELDGLCDLFLAEYQRMAPVSRERVALWETLYLLESGLDSWIKLEPDRLEGSMALLERHVRQSRLSFA